jgi:uncharacterized membrane protein HdeD (DUF308 family)
MKNNQVRNRQTRHGWLFILRGVIFLLLGIWVTRTPASSYTIFSLMVGLAVIASGVTELIHAAYNHLIGFSWLRMVAGVIELGLGALLITHLAVEIAALPYVTAVFFLARGLSLATLAPAIRGFMWMMAGGLMMVLFAVITVLNPAYGITTATLWIGLGFIIAGIVNILLFIRLSGR